MTIRSFDTVIFNIKSDAFYINKKNVINGKFLSHKHSHKKSYNKKRDFS